MRTLMLLAAAAALAAGTQALHAADIENAKAKVEQVCKTCHGADGNTPLTPDTPRLAGQHYDYLVKAMKDYRGGKRQNPMMGPMAASLTDKDIKDLAAYFAAQPGGVQDKY